MHGALPKGTRQFQQERATIDVFVGLDVSLASTALCVVSEKSKIVREAQVPSEPEKLIVLMCDLPYGIVPAGLEACPLSQWLHKGLSAACFETVLMKARQVKSALQAMPVRTDRRDAEDTAVAPNDHPK